MSLILNILWFVFGGFASGFAWLVGAFVMAISIVGLPWAPAALRLAMFSFAPFGRQAVDRRWVTGREDLGSGPFGLVLNILWFVCAGWYIALVHLVLGVGLLITIIGIPFGLQHFKLAAIAVAPVGKTIVPA
jgi:uncharacterized membrane protein YccF (DUF307 family)